MRKRLPHLIGLLLVVAAAAATAFVFRVAIRDAWAFAVKPKLPKAQPYRPQTAPKVPGTAAVPGTSEPAPEPKPAAPSSKSTVNGQRSTVEARSANLAVPFTPQAPHANWDMPYQEACEEASLVMVHAYLTGVASFTPEAADGLIKDVVAWEETRFGYYEDTTAEETAAIARELYGHAGAKVLPVRSIADVKAQLDLGKPVILPAAGRLLKNPYFRGSGPLYHMLVAKGYTKDGKIITNDPGTRRGADFLYDPDVLFEAIHDWNDGKVEEGAKVMIVLE